MKNASSNASRREDASSVCDDAHSSNGDSPEGHLVAAATAVQLDSDSEAKGDTEVTHRRSNVGTAVETSLEQGKIQVESICFRNQSACVSLSS